MTEPTDDVPDFIIEKLHNYDTNQLRAITDHLLGNSTTSSGELPADFQEILVEQNETTVKAIGEAADQMATEASKSKLTGYEGMTQDIIDCARAEIGDEVAISVAQDIEMISIDEAGIVWEVAGEKQLVVEQLADQYIGLAGAWIKNEFSDIADEYDVESPVNLSNNPFG